MVEVRVPMSVNMIVGLEIHHYYHTPHQTRNTERSC